MKTLPYIHKWAKYDYRLMIPTGKDILGNHTFKTASSHKSKQSAHKALTAYQQAT